MKKRIYQIVFYILMALALSIFGPAVLAVDEVKPASSGFLPEWNYPSIPGVGPFELGKPMDFYVRYFVNLAFLIAAGVCLMVMIWAGVVYIATSYGSKQANLLVKAREWLRRAALGMAILLTSYLVLITINPQFSILKFNVPKLPPKPAVPVQIIKNEVVFTKAAGLAVPEKFLAVLSEFATTTNEKGEEELLVDDDNNVVFKVEQPFLELERSLDETIKISKAIQKILADCKCGDAKFHVIESVFRSRCVAGMDEEDAKAKKEELKTKKVSPPGRLECLLRCTDCLTNKRCDLETVNKLKQELLRMLGNPPSEQALAGVDPEWAQKLRDLQATTTALLNAGKDPAEIEKEKKKPQPDWVDNKTLWAQTPKFALLRLTEIAEILRQNADEFFISNADGYFQNDYQAFQKEVESSGYQTIEDAPPHLGNEEPPPQEDTNPLAPPTSLIESQPSLLFTIKMYWRDFRQTIFSPFLEAVAASDPAVPVKKKRAIMVSPERTEEKLKGADVFRAITEAPGGFNLVAPATIRNNQRIKTESSKANFTAVIMQLTLQELEQIFQGCVAAALKRGEFRITKVEMFKILEQAIKEMDQDLLSRVVQMVPELAAFFKDDLQGKIKDSYGGRFHEQVKICRANCDSVCGIDPKCLNPCRDNCIAPEPNFVSKIFSDFLTSKFKDKLPQAIQDILNGPLRDAIFTEDLNAKLDKDIVDILPTVVHNGLTKSFVELLPQLQETLNTKLTDITFLSPVNNALAKIDNFLASSTKDMFDNLDKLTNDAAPFIAKTITNYGFMPVDKTIENFRRDRPYTFAEYDLINCPDRVFSEGRTLVNTKTKTGSCPGPIPFEDFEKNTECMRLDPEGITGLQQIPVKLVVRTCQQLIGGPILERCVEEDIADINNPQGLIVDNVASVTRKILLNCMTVLGKEKGKICRAAGYCWGPADGGYDEGSEEFYSCFKCGGGVGLQDIPRSLNRDWGKTAVNVVVGMVNWTEKLVSAIIETLIYTATQYAKVWIEDELLSPLKPFFTQVSNFQKDFHKFINGTIADVLPDKVNKLLSKNVDTLMGDICNIYQQAILNADEPKIEIVAPFEWDGVLWNDLPVTYKGATVGLNKDAGKAACYYTKHLHSTVLEELSARGRIGKGIVETLKTDVFDLLPTSTQDFLNKTPADLLFGATEGAKELAEGNLKQIVCGELITADFKPHVGGNVSLYDACGALQKTGSLSLEQIKDFKAAREKSAGEALSQLSVGFFPQVDTKKAKEKHPNNYDKLIPICYFNYYGCRNPLSAFQGKTLGLTLAQLLTFTCNSVEWWAAKDGLKCDNWDKSDFKPAPDKSDTWVDFQKSVCQSCDLLQNHSAAYVAIRGLMWLTYGAPTKSPDERNSYQWLYVAFPEWRGDIQAVAQVRGFYDIQNDFAKLEDYTEPNTLPDNIQNGAKMIISWFSENRTVGDVLTAFPLGVIKPFVKGEASLLRKKGGGATKNFLSLTAYELIHNEVCRNKIENDFTEKYPDYTFEKLQDRAYRQRLANVLPYSVESYDKITISDTLNMIAGINDPALLPEEKDNYITCVSLDFSPAEIMGLNETLDYYVRPKEFRILFSLIRDLLLPQERPEPLNKFLNYLYSKTPVTMLADIGRQMENNGDKQLVFSVELARFGVSFEQEFAQALRENGPISNSSYLMAVLEAQDVRSRAKPNEPLSPDTVLIKISEEKNLEKWNLRDTDYQIWLEFTGAHYITQVYLMPIASGDAIIDFAKFLNTPMADQIKRAYPDPLINYLMPKADRDKGLGSDAWTKMQEMFLNRPMELLALKYPNPLFEKTLSNKCRLKETGKDCLFGEKQVRGSSMKSGDLVNARADALYCCQEMSAMSVLAQKSSVFGRPYLDLLLGRFRNKIARIYEKEQDVKDEIGKAVSSLQDKIKETFDKAFIDAPGWLWQKISELFSKKFGQNTADMLGGACKDNLGFEEKTDLVTGKKIKVPIPIKSEKDCKAARDNCPETDETCQGEFFRVNPDKNVLFNECCSLGAPLVCQPKCRLKEIGKDCLTSEGEAQIEGSKMKSADLVGAKTDALYCCFTGCNQCYLANAKEKIKMSCSRKGDKFKTITVGSVLENVCCHQRVTKPMVEGGKVIGNGCCVTVTDCIIGNFIGRWENTYGLMLSTGSVPSSGLKDAKPKEK